jgi:hypothetical protein
MNPPPSRTGSNHQAQFCLRFERHLRRLSSDRRCSIADGFGLAWEKALDEVPLQDEEQPAVYWQLLCWAKRSELFTSETLPTLRGARPHDRIRR